MRTFPAVTLLLLCLAQFGVTPRTAWAGDTSQMQRAIGWQMAGRLLEANGLDANQTVGGRRILDLCHCLGDPDAAAQQDAAGRLRAAGDVVLPYLAAGLAIADADTEDAVISLLVDIAPAAVSERMALLASSDPLLRGAGACVLAVRPAPQALAPLRKTLSDDDPVVRSWAALAIGALGEPAATAVPDLLRMIEDEAEPSVRAAGVIGLCGLGPRGTTEAATWLARPAHRDTNPGTWQTWRRYGLFDAAGRLVGADDAHVRAYALRLLGHAEDPPVSLEPRLADHLGDPDASVRWEALFHLSRVPGGVGRHADGVRALLDDPDPRVASMAAVVLAESAPTPDLAPRLTHALASASDGKGDWLEAVRMSRPASGIGEPDTTRIARALARLADAGRSALAAMLEDPEARLRQRAATAFGEGELPGPGPLAKALEDPDVGVRRAAAKSLLLHQVADARAAAIELDALAWTAGEAQDLKEREAAIGRLASLGSAVVPVLAAALPTAGKKNLDDAVAAVIEKLGPNAAALVPDLLAQERWAAGGRLERAIRAIGEAARAPLEAIRDAQDKSEEERARAKAALRWLGG